jgi:hypothetical protein
MVRFWWNSRFDVIPYAYEIFYFSAFMISIGLFHRWASYCFRFVKQLGQPTRLKIVAFLVMVFIGPFIAATYLIIGSSKTLEYAIVGCIPNYEKEE